VRAARLRHRAATRLTEGIARRIVAYHTDDEGHWVAELECGHGQHVRHDPPWQQRHWVITPEGRSKHMGTELHCVLCASKPEEM
jgi:hypothetical protein